MKRYSDGLRWLPSHLEVLARKPAFPTRRNFIVVKPGDLTYKEQLTVATKWPKGLSIIYITSIKVEPNG